MSHPGVLLTEIEGVAAKRPSTRSWLLPPSVRRLREHLREIRRVAAETQQQVIDTHRQTAEILAALGGQVAELEILARRHARELSRIAAQVEELVAQSPDVALHRESAPSCVSADNPSAIKHSRRTTRQPTTGRGQAIVLAYHHVAEPTTDPFELAVAPAQFEEHLQVLSALGHTITVSELSRGIASGRLPKVSFAVTFDDGYADNLHTAKPILRRYRVPATVFVATGCLGGTPFWWDELGQLMLNDGGVGEQLVLEVDGASYSWRLNQGAREEICWEVRELLRGLDPEPRRRALAAASSQLGRPSPPNSRSLTEEEVVELAKDGLVDVGAHTRTHPVLARITDEAARDEIEGSKAWLQGCLQRTVSSFAYPYGEYSPRDVSIVQAAGFDIAFSTATRPATFGCDPLQVPRLYVGNWDGEELERSLIGLLGAT